MERYSRHFGLASSKNGERKDIIILGYNHVNNSVMVVDIDSLPGDDANELKRLALTTEAQRSDYLIPILEKTSYRNGTKSWWEYLCSLLKSKQVGVMSFLHVAEMNQEQKNFFKGYGLSAEELENRNEQPKVRSSKQQTADTNEKMTSILEEILNQNKMLAERIEKLESGKTEAKKTTTTKRGRKPAKAKSAKKATPIVEENVDVTETVTEDTFSFDDAEFNSDFNTDFQS